MKILKKAQVIVGMTLVATLLTACDPPMPPELVAQLAEQSYTCYEGDAKVYTQPATQGIVSTLSENLAGACTGDLAPMTISVAESAAAADLVLAPSEVKECQAFATVPYGFDAGVVAYNIEGTDSLNLSYKNMAAVLNGEITTWSDPKIAKDNPDLTLPDEPVVIRTQADANSLTALATALGYQGAKLDVTKFETTNFYDGQEFAALSSGEVAIIPNSIAVANGSVTVGMLSGKKDPDTGAKLFAGPSEESLYASGTQLVAKVTGDTLTASIDPKLAPKAMFEGETAAVPYQAIFPLNLYLCGEDTKLKRAVAAFMLRLDSQGALGYLNISQLPESLRYSAVGLVRKGLPVPKVTKKSE
ncbi:MAG: substrate-binding domain-containing protein [Micrococcales bacterium]